MESAAAAGDADTIGEGATVGRRGVVVGDIVVVGRILLLRPAARRLRSRHFRFVDQLFAVDAVVHPVDVSLRPGLEIVAPLPLAVSDQVFDDGGGSGGRRMLFFVVDRTLHGAAGQSDVLFRSDGRGCFDGDGRARRLR